MSPAGIVVFIEIFEYLRRVLWFEVDIAGVGTIRQFGGMELLGETVDDSIEAMVSFIYFGLDGDIPRMEEVIKKGGRECRFGGKD